MSEERKLQWEKLKEEVCAMGGDGEDFVDALSDFYTLYSEKLIDWYAGLFDADIGGFYFANSGRDTEGYLPDIEATKQSLDFFEKIEGVSCYTDVLPYWMKNKIGKWVKGLQDPNGYFYHPQWSRERTDQMLPRKGRDLNYGLEVIFKCGFNPTYDTPLGHKGDGLLPDGTPVKTTVAKLGSDNTEREVSTLSFPPHLENPRAFSEFLNSHLSDLCTRPYYTGNLFSNQVSQIKMRDKMLREAGETESLADILIDWFDKHQNPKTGGWYFPKEGEVTSQSFVYETNNSLLKIIDVYNQLGRELKYPLEAARSAMQTMLYKEPANSVCDVYNTWNAVWFIIQNIDNYSSLPKKEKEKYIETIRRELLKDAPECIRASKKKVETFRRLGDAFSYTPTGTSITSQSMYVALPGYDEGDTNATTICIGGSTRNLFKIFNLTPILPYEREVLDKYLALLEAKRPKDCLSAQ